MSGLGSKNGREPFFMGNSRGEARHIVLQCVNRHAWNNIMHFWWHLCPIVFHFKVVLHSEQHRFFRRNPWVLLPCRVSLGLHGDSMGEFVLNKESILFRVFSVVVAVHIYHVNSDTPLPRQLFSFLCMHVTIWQVLDAPLPEQWQGNARRLRGERDKSLWMWSGVGGFAGSDPSLMASWRSAILPTYPATAGLPNLIYSGQVTGFERRSTTQQRIKMETCVHCRLGCASPHPSSLWRIL